MRIVHIVPGSGGTFYCQNCLRDEALVKVLRRQGHDVVVVPMYLPLLSDDPDGGEGGPVFYGAVNLYLMQRFPALRRAPSWVKRLLDSPQVLAWAARKAGSTRATGLAEMTLSVLRGEDGGQAAELDQMVSWLSREGGADVVHLSNALLLGLAGRIRRELGAAVVCSLQDEDVWVNAMEPDEADLVWRTMAARVPDTDGFVAASRTYARVLADKMEIPEERLHVVYPGIELDGYEQAPMAFEPPTLGFLSRLSESLGLGVLVEAFIILKKEACFKDLRLRAMGGQTGDDRRFLRRLERRLSRLGLSRSVEFLPAFDRPRRIEFLRSLSMLSVPIPGGEAFGAFQVEAMACGVPVVQPEAGAFPEIVRLTGGGVIYSPNEAAPLAAALRELLLDPVRARSLGRHGRRVVTAQFGIEGMAANMCRLYETVTAR